MAFKNKIIIFGIIYVIFSFSCEKPKVHPIPHTNLDLLINLTNAEYSALKTPGNNLVIESEGIKGIILFCIDLDEYIALEAVCPYEYGSGNENCAVGVDGSLAICPCCGSEFFLLDNSLMKGPSQWPLKKHNVTKLGGSLLIE